MNVKLGGGGFRGTSVPRYFFVVQWPGVEVDDPQGTLLPHDAAAIAFAERCIQEIKEDKSLADPSMAMIVKREAFGTVLTIPFFPGNS
jgi:hypothetical protein